MRLRILKSFITHVILLLYVITPVFDSMVCAGCMDNAPLQCETASGSLQSSYDMIIYPSHNGPQSKTPATDEHAAKSFCSICANILTGVAVFPSNVHFSAAQWDGPCTEPARSELYNSITKPPQNYLV
jgi:hypothetical protein